MEFITVSAKNVEDAITEAQIQLGVTRDHLDYEVIEKGSAGFLGIGMKQAVIKARKKEEEAVAAEEVVKETIKEVEVKEEVKTEEIFAVKEEKEIKKDTKKEEKPHKTDKYPEKKFEKSSKKRAPKKEYIKEAPVKKEVELAKVEDATIQACEKFIYDVLHAMDMGDVKVTSKVDEEGALAINVEGENMGILIGKRGQTLDSLQYLTNRVANKTQTGYVRVKLDTENYRSRRRDTLENLARNIASKVKKTRRTVSLEPMNPYERRIIHSTLQTDPAVATHSEGEEPYRKVVVTYVRNNR